MSSRVYRRVAMAAALAIALIPGSTTFASAQDVSEPSAAPAEPTPAPASAEDGRTVFRGLFFGQGPVADTLSERADFSKLKEGHELNTTTEAYAAADHFLDIIDSQSPQFLSTFGGDLRSGDPKRIDAALTKGARALSDAGITVEKRDVGPDCGVYVFVGAAVVHVAAAVTAAAGAVTVTVAVGANLVYAQNWFWGGDSATSSGLSQEQAVATLAKTLAA